MKKQNSLYLIALLFLFSSCQKNLLEQEQQTPVDSFPVNQNHPMKDSLLTIIEKYTKSGLPGIQVAVYNDQGYFMATSGYAKIENQVRMTLNNPSWQFSITKMYTAALILKLKELGLVNLDTRIGEMGINLINENIDGRMQITIRQLLNHSSGITDLTALPEFMVGQLNAPLDQPSVEQRMAMLNGKPLEYPPGSDFSYSNSNYLILQLIAEKVSGKSYLQLLNTYILEPLNLDKTWFEPTESFTISQGFPNYYFDRYANEQLENISRWNTALARHSDGYGGIAASPADVITFMNALFNGHIISQASLAEMKSWITGQHSTQPDYGLGLEYYQYAPGRSPQFGHEGDGIGCSTQAFYSPDNKTFLYINITAGRKLYGPYLFKITDLKNDLCKYVANW